MPRAAIASLTMYLAQNGAERGAAVAHARERSPARALELDVTAHPISVVHLAKQHRTAVAKLRHPVAELMPGIGHREGFGPFRQPVARQHLHTVLAPASWAEQP
jgi:hypothetical protein